MKNDKYFPWGRGAVEVEPQLKQWAKKWAGRDTIFLNPKDWFLRGHDMCGGFYDNKKYWYPKSKKGTYVWAPPPIAADVCLIELRNARMKRRLSLHIVIIQRLMTSEWMK